LIEKQGKQFLTKNKKKQKQNDEEIVFLKKE